MSKASIIAPYDDPRDEIRRPDDYMALSVYYMDRWLPTLGERGHVIVSVLRRYGYYQRKQNIVRQEVDIEQSELARLCGLSLRTFQREFGAEKDGRPVNPALHQFVQRQFRTYQNTAGQVVREKTVYVVQMKDPIHPDDLPRLQRITKEREKGTARSRQDGGNGDGRIRQVGAGRRPNGGASCQDGETSRQVGGNNKECMTPKNEKTLETATPPESSASLSGGEGREPGKCDPTVLPAWQDTRAFLVKRAGRP